MSGILAALQTGSWLTSERMRLIAIGLLVASVAAVVFLAATGQGPNDYQDRPLGTDFSNVYAAGTYVLEGAPTAPFDPALQHAREKEIFGAATPFYGWHYPPFFLLIAAALALMPYLPALALWQGATLVLYLLSVRSILSRTLGRDPDRPWLLFTLAFPAVFVNITHGHNGFLTAALIGTALVLLDRRPVLAGILIGLLVYKPQFGLLIPLVLIATARWRVFFSAAATVIALVLMTTFAFGAQVWEAFIASMHFTRTVVLEDGNTGWQKIQSVFAWMRMWGSPVSLAYAIQGAVTLSLALSLAWLWRSTATFALKAAALAIAIVLATPYSLDYDMMVTAVAIAFLAAHGTTRGFLSWEKTALVALWIAPVVTRAVAEHLLIPFGTLSMLAMYALVLRRAVNDQKLRVALSLKSSGSRA